MTKGVVLVEMLATVSFEHPYHSDSLIHLANLNIALRIAGLGPSSDGLFIFAPHHISVLLKYLRSPWAQLAAHRLPNKLLRGYSVITHLVPQIDSVLGL